MNRIAVFFIIIYRKFISPIKPATCRFYPTCSDYSLQAFRKYNFIHALILTLNRIFRCHPFHPGGYDPLK